MTTPLATLLHVHGPALSSEIVRRWVQQGVSAQAARKRVSRLPAGVKRLAYLTFPRNARFLYLEKHFGSSQYWDALIKELLATNSAYGLALVALRVRGGIIPQAHFAIACGAPLKQKKHLSPETVLARLEKAKLIAMQLVPGVGPCIALMQGPDRYQGARAQIQARLIVEDILLKAIASWLKNLNIVSYGRVAARGTGAKPPTVGTLAWDLTGPSYLGAMMRRRTAYDSKPGFVACDVLCGAQMDEEGLQPFIHKCATLRALQRVGPCLQIFVADHFSPKAFALAKKSGIVPATPENLFGEEVAEGLHNLFDILSDAAQFAMQPEVFDQVFRQLGRVEGAAGNLRGALFEYLVAEIVRRSDATPIVRIARTYTLGTGEKVEADVVCEVQDRSVTFIECKGHKPAGLLDDNEVNLWLTTRIPRLYKYARAHSDWRNLEIRFELWTTSNLSDAAHQQVDEAAAAVKPTRYTIYLKEAEAIRTVAKTLKDKALLKTLDAHFLEHPLAAAERTAIRYVRRPHSLASEPSGSVESGELPDVIKPASEFISTESKDDSEVPF